MFIPWWKAGGMLINPVHVASVEFFRDENGELIARIFLVTPRPGGGGVRLTARGQDARKVQELCNVLADDCRPQLAYFFADNDEHNNGSDSMREAA